MKTPPRIASYGWTRSPADASIIYFGCAVPTAAGTIHFFTVADQSALEFTEAWLLTMGRCCPPGKLLRELRRNMIECPPGKTLSINLTVHHKP